jgi:hypothetical protein
MLAAVCDRTPTGISLSTVPENNIILILGTATPPTPLITTKHINFCPLKWDVAT